jgi:hypothetical protein
MACPFSPATIGYVQASLAGSVVDALWVHPLSPQNAKCRMVGGFPELSVT